jgi:hypothetical protein
MVQILSWRWCFESVLRCDAQAASLKRRSSAVVCFYSEAAACWRLSDAALSAWVDLPSCAPAHRLASQDKRQGEEDFLLLFK